MAGGTDGACTGADSLHADAPGTAVGIDMLWSRDALPEVAVSCDLATALVHDRVAFVSFLARPRSAIAPAASPEADGGGQARR